MRIGQLGQERPAVRISDDSYIDVSDVTAHFDERFFASGGLSALQQTVTERQAAGEVWPLNGERIGAPVARPHQILCIGLNYSDHAAETGQAIPDEPIVFNKSPNTLIGPHDCVRIPRGASKTDWEVELGIVIGARSSYLRDETEAAAAIVGYVVVNDISERAFQIERGGQWVKGKSAETFNPCGPYLVTTEDVPNVLNLGMWLNVNGVRRQRGNTATMLPTRCRYELRTADLASARRCHGTRHRLSWNTAPEGPRRVCAVFRHALAPCRACA